MFAEDYPRFIEVSELTPKSQPQDGRQRRRGRDVIEQQNRMNERYEALFTSNRDIFDGARCSIWPATTGDTHSQR